MTPELRRVLEAVPPSKLSPAMVARLAWITDGHAVTDRPDSTDWALADRGLIAIQAAPHENAPGGHMACTRFYRTVIRRTQAGRDFLKGEP